jgi:hypothetical protein
VRTSKVDPIDGPVHEYCQVSSLRRFNGSSGADYL